MRTANQMEMRDFSVHSPVDPSQLEFLGKQAAEHAEMNATSLTDAVVYTIGKTKLNSEQVRRVVEFANHEAFHQKYSSMDSRYRVVDIEGGPADPVEVLQRLNDGARPGVTYTDSLEYLRAPEKRAAMEMDFGLGETSSDEPMSKSRALFEVLELRQKLSAAHENVVAEAGSHHMQMTEALSNLREQVLMAKNAGLFTEDLVSAWSAVDPSLCKVAMAKMPFLPSRGATKVAHKINPAHPVVTLYAEFVKHAHEYGRYDLARREIERQLSKSNSFVSERV